MNRTSFRFANENDCGLILFFIKQLAEYEKMSDLVVATEEELKRAGKEYLNQVIIDNELNCLVTACGHVPTNLAAISGSCSMVIPARKPNMEKYDPLSYYMMARAYDEAELIQLAYVLEKNLDINAIPDWVIK